MGLESFAGFQEKSEIRFDELDNLLMNCIGTSPDYDIEYGFQVSNSSRRDLYDRLVPKIKRRDIGKISGRLLLAELVSVDFECLEEVDSEDQVKYAGIKFSLFNPHYHPEERIQTWDNVRRCVGTYFQQREQEKALYP